MKVVKREFEVYEFNELSEEAKQKAIDLWYETEDFPFLEDDIKEEMKQIDSCFYDVQLQYSLSCCQGDGLSFEGTLNLEKFLNEVYSKKLRSSYKRALNDFIYDVGSEGNTGHYCYGHKNQIIYDENYQDFKDHKYINKLWDDVLEEIKEYYLNICKKLEKYGYEILEYRMTFNEFSEHCEINGYNFYDDGTMANL